MSKTPITILEETCAKQIPRERPVFTETTETVGDNTDPGSRFVIKCNALGYSSVGKGVTKKAARHNAAENLLLKYNHQTDEDMSDDDEDAKSAATGGNAISELLDYCVVKNFHKAQFTCISEVGPSHSPTFTFECKLNSITREGKAGIKQIAKQNAAKAVLEILKMSYPDSEKKLVIPNTSTETIIRQKVTSYHEAKKRNLIDKMGTSIKNRHRFFRTQESDFLKSITAVLQRQDLTEHHKYELLLAELQAMQWNPQIQAVEGTDLLSFVLSIEYDKFTCCLISSNEEQLKRDALNYFHEMMLLYESPVNDLCDGELEEIHLEPL